MKLTKSNSILGLFVLMSIVYAYANITDATWLLYISKILLTPTLLIYYVLTTRKVNTLFVLALVFIFSENMFVLNKEPTFFILGMGFALLFILMQMLIVTNRIGEIDIKKFLKILIPFMFIFLGILYFIFKNGGDITWIYYVLGFIIAIYGSFSFYLYFKEKSEAALHYLIGTIFFILSAIVKGLNMIDDRNIYLKVFNIIFYVISLIFIAKAIISFDASKKPTNAVKGD